MSAVNGKASAHTTIGERLGMTVEEEMQFTLDVQRKLAFGPNVVVSFEDFERWIVRLNAREEDSHQ